MTVTVRTDATRMTETQQRLYDSILIEKASADGYNSDALQAKRAQALAYYNCDPRGDEVEDRSQVVSPDLAAAVNATLALMRGMLIEECSVAVNPLGPEDQAQADAESQVVRDVLFKYQDGELQLMNAIKDGFLSATCVVCVEAEEDEQGRRTFTARAVPSENVSFQAAYEGPFQKIRYFCERVYYTRSQLHGMGIPESVTMRLGTGSDHNPRDVSTSQKHDANEPQGDVLECYWVLVRVDLNNDGETELYRVLCGPEDQVLQHEEWDVINYVVGVPFIAPHRIVGESFYDRLKQVQDINTGLERQLQDNVAISNVGRYLYNPARVDENDVMKPTAGGGIRTTDMNSLVQLMVPDTTTGILAALQFQKQQRSEIAGAALDMASAEAQLMHKTATAASIDKNNAELITSLVARTLALTLIEPLFRLTHYMLRTYATSNYPAEISGQIVPIDPLTWSDRRTFTVNVGKSPAEKTMETMALNQHLQYQVAAMQNGMRGVMADERTLYRTSQRLLELAGVENPETFAIDPTSPEAIQAAEQAQQMAAQQAQQMAAMQKRVTDLEQAKIIEDGRQADQSLQFDYHKLEVETEVEMEKVTAEQVIDLEKQRRDHDAQATQQGTAIAADERAASAAGDGR